MLEAVYAQGQDDPGHPTDPLALARQDGAGMVIRGSYYLSGDSVLFQASIMDVATGRVLRSFDPVGAPVERADRRPRGAAGAGRSRSQPAGQSRSIAAIPSIPIWWRRRAFQPTASSWRVSNREIR